MTPKVRELLKAINDANEAKIEACTELYRALILDEVGDAGWEYLALGRKYSREPRR